MLVIALGVSLSCNAILKMSFLLRSARLLHFLTRELKRNTFFRRLGWNLNVLPHLPGSVLKHLGFVQGKEN